jgi:hypothetical protein
MKPLHEMSLEEALSERNRRLELQRRGLPFDTPTVCTGFETPDDVSDARLEKAIVAAADKQLRSLGFVVWNLSQARASKIACGVPDRLYTCPSRGLAVFWEAKSATGTQRPDQRLFQEHMDACGWHYVVGTDRELYAWLLARYPLQWDEAGHLSWRTE